MRVALTILGVVLGGANAAAQEQVDPITIIESRLEKIRRNVPVTYQTNSTEVFCTIHCRDLDEKTAVYDAFRNTRTLGLAAASDPPTVTVVLVFRPDQFEAKRKARALTSNVKSSETKITGKVVQKVDGGVLVLLPSEHVVMVADAPDGYVDQDPFEHLCYWMGEHYEHGLKTLRKYTYSRERAVERWEPVSSAQAREQKNRHVTPATPE